MSQKISHFPFSLDQISKGVCIQEHVYNIPFINYDDSRPSSMNVGSLM